MSLYGTVRKVYTAALPKGLRHALFVITPGPLKRLRAKTIQAMERGATHEEMYDADYYAKYVDPGMGESVGAISSSIMERFSPQTAVDVGCGTGRLLVALRERGVRVQGMEYSQAACKICEERGLKVYRVDLEKDAIPPLKADVVVSTEVAEHLPERCANHFVDVLCGISSTVVLTAATPGQGGTDHVNEQPHEYWIEKFRGRGYEYLEADTLAWRRRWKDAGALGCYYSNVMLFRRAS
jgi:SAM-dependent methyltransferase